MAEWRYELQTNIGEVLNQLKTLQNRVDELENGKHQINLDIDSKKLEKVITNLDKMLESLGKGTGDFKEFENLSKELSSIVSEVQNLSKAFGKVDDSGTKTLLSSIQNIDKSLSELSQHIINVNKNMSNIGGDTNSAVKQVDNISNAYDNAAKNAEKLADAQNKIDTDKSNISSDQNIISSTSNTSAPAITEESNALQKVSSSAIEAADAKEKFTAANNEVKSSADASIPSVEKESDALNEMKAWNDNVKVVQDYVDAVSKLNNLKSKDNGTGKYSNEIALQIEKIQKLELAAKDAKVALSSMVNPHTISTESWKEYLDIMNQIDQAASGSAESIAKLKDSQLSSIQKTIDSYSGDYNKRNIKPTNENRSAEYQQLLDKYKASIDALQAKKEELAKQTTISEADLNSVKNMTEAVEENKNALIAMSAAEKGSSEGARRKEIDKITKYLKDNTRISEEAKTKLKEYLDLLRNGGSNVNVEDIHNQFLKVTEAERLAGNEGKRFLDVIRDKAWYGWAAQIASYFSLQDIIRYFKEGATVVKEFDDGLTNISYTMDITKSQLDGIGQSVLDLSKDLKSSIDDSMQVAKIYANMNTTAEEIKKLSEPTLIMSNLTGFDASTMADDIQAVTQQFEIAAEDSMHIADVYDTISRNISVDYSKILELTLETM